jgi:hypothetical protein
MRLARNNRLVDWQLQGGVLDDLAQGRVYPVLAPRKVSNSLAMGNGLDERGDKERSLVAENVGTETISSGITMFPEPEPMTASSMCCIDCTYTSMKISTERSNTAFWR